MLNILIDAFFPLLCSLQSKWYFGNLPEDSKDEVYCVVLQCCVAQCQCSVCSEGYKVPLVSVRYLKAD